MIAVFVNCFAVIAGGVLGLLVGKRVGESFRDVVFSCAGLTTIVMGIQMALQSSNFLSLLVSLLLGGFLGYALRLEDRILSLGEKISRLLGESEQDVVEEGMSPGARFAHGFLNASVLFCSGAMSVVGSIQAGVSGEMSTIFIKSVMDGCMAVVFGSVYGIGVVFSALFILVYQGFFTLLGGWIEPLLGPLGIGELSAAGGVLLIMIGLGLLGLKKFKTANFTFALVFAPILGRLAERLF